MSVLKDASSTSIYGARTANGVVVITTKRGSLGKAKVTARAQVGFSSLARNNWNMMNTAERIATSGQQHDQLTNIASGTVARSWVDNSTSYSYLSFFGRGEYNYGGRYYADFSVRADASSRFGKSGRWAAFWSLGFMWDLRNEKFMRGAAPWLTTAQIAVSTGTSGNSSIPDYDHLDLAGGGSDYHNMLMAVPQSYANGGFSARWDNVGAMLRPEWNVEMVPRPFPSSKGCPSMLISATCKRSWMP